MYYLSRFFEKIRPVARKKCVLDKTAKLEGGTQIINSSMGKYSYCGYDCKIINTTIGAFCSIASNVKIGLLGHPISWVSTSPAFYQGHDSIRKDIASLRYVENVHTEIGNDVWIGEDAKIKAGVKISDGAIIGMGAVVTSDIGPYEIWAGIPARCIRKRFDDSIIKELLKTKWWDMDKNTLKELAQYMDTPTVFIENYKKKEI